MLECPYLPLLGSTDLINSTFSLDGGILNIGAGTLITFFSLLKKVQRMIYFQKMTFAPNPTEQCLNLAAQKYLCYVSWLRICQLFTVLTGVIFQMSELPDPGMKQSIQGLS